jgi:flavin reductase (DIM6/NTAB) family NADH-FMN oxidoreductase RutF
MPLAGAARPTTDLRSAFRSAASSVWVVTSAFASVPVGFTAISVVSVSTAPPVLSFNVGSASSSLPALTRSARFAAHLLTAAQEDLARRFAADAAARFPHDGTWDWDPDGLPAVVGCAVRLSGRVSSFVPAGDSFIAIGAVDRIEPGPPSTGVLVHRDRGYLPSPSPFPTPDGDLR